MPVTEQGRRYLCCQEEDLVRDVPDPAGDDPQSHSREHVGVVSLPRNEGPAIFQSHTLKGTSAGKDPPALEAGRKSDVAWRSALGSQGGLDSSPEYWTLHHPLPNAQHWAEDAEHVALVYLT